jgi:hypothetical protein
MAQPAMDQTEMDFAVDPGYRSEPSFTRAADHGDPADIPDMDSLSRAVTGIANGTRAAQPPQAPQRPVEEPRRAQSLLGRMLPGLRSRAEATAQAPVPPAPQPRLGNVETRREPTASRQSDDLDIPTFLRRQAN